MATTKKYISLEKLGVYDEKIKGVISAGDDAALASAKSYADGLAVNYEAAGAAATAEANAKAYADGKDAKIAEAKQAGVDAAAAASAADAKGAQGISDAAAAKNRADAAYSLAEGKIDYVEVGDTTYPDFNEIVTA